MSKKKRKQEELEDQERMLNIEREPELEILKKKTIKELIAPSGIDA